MVSKAQLRLRRPTQISFGSRLILHIMQDLLIGKNISFIKCLFMRKIGDGTHFNTVKHAGIKFEVNETVFKISP